MNDNLTRAQEAQQYYYQQMFDRIFPERAVQQHKQERLGYLYTQLAELEAGLVILEEGLGYKYNPNQPRVPAGNPDGGQWTAVGRSADDAEEDFVDRDDPAFMAYNPAPYPRSRQARQVNIFIGGADDEGQIVEIFGSNSPVKNSRTVRRSIGANYYFTHRDADKINALIAKLPKDVSINLVGHSWGGDTAADMALSNPGKVRNLITIDPVSKIKPDFDKLRNSVYRWTNVNAARRPGSSWFTPANAVAGIGGSWDDAPSGDASLFIEAPFDHGDFDAMMGFSDSSGVNPQSIIDEGL